MDDTIRTMARRQLDGQGVDDEEALRKAEEMRAAEEGAAEAEAWAARQMKVGRAEDEESLDARLRRNSKRIAYGWSALDDPPRPGVFDE